MAVGIGLSNPRIIEPSDYRYMIISRDITDTVSGERKLELTASELRHLQFQLITPKVPITKTLLFPATSQSTFLKWP